MLFIIINIRHPKDISLFVLILHNSLLSLLFNVYNIIDNKISSCHLIIEIICTLYK